MESEHPELEPEPDSGFDRIDADAVCERCAMVNPPEALLCRNCGNNLRDQRRDRLALAHVDEALDRSRPRRVMSVLLTCFGFLLILWTAFNISDVESWLAEDMFASEPWDESDAGVYWSPDNSGIYEELLRELSANPITMGEASRAVREPALPKDDYTGRYVIWRESRSVRRAPSQAYVRQEGDEVYFVALVGRPGRRIEVRGKAKIVASGGLNSILVGFKRGDEVGGGYGLIDLNGRGGLDCLGRTQTGDEQISASLYFVP